MLTALPQPALLFVFAYVGLLARLSWIDIRCRLLPDNLTFPLLWAGLLCQVCVFPDRLASAVIGAVTGYLSLWALYWGYYLLRKHEGIGYGDMKLLAALGAWHGWHNLPGILLIAAGCGLVFAGIRRIKQRAAGGKFTTPLPFGPCLAIAGGVTGWFDGFPSPISWLL